MLAESHRAALEAAVPVLELELVAAERAYRHRHGASALVIERYDAALAALEGVRALLGRPCGPHYPALNHAGALEAARLARTQPLHVFDD